MLNATPEIVRERSLEACYAAIIGVICERIQESFDSQGYATLAFSGGKTPAGLFQAIARSPMVKDLPWHKVFIFFVDERVAPPDHQDSNYGLFRKYLSGFLPFIESQIYRMPVELTPLAEGANQYQRTMAEVFSMLTKRQYREIEDQYPTFDLILLGMGSDGHTASLFPLHSALDQNSWVTPVDAEQAIPPIPRLTLTLPVINHADTVVFLISGEEKIRLAESFLSNSPQSKFPASLVQPKRRLLWYMVQEGVQV